MITELGIALSVLGLVFCLTFPSLWRSGRCPGLTLYVVELTLLARDLQYRKLSDVLRELKNQ